MNDIPYLGGRPDFFPDPHLVPMSRIIRPFRSGEPADAGLVGLPFDRGVISHRQGARFAPQALRELLLDYSTFNLDLEVDLGDLRLADCGDVQVAINDFDETHRRVEQALTPLFQHGMPLLIIGGDHSLTAPAIKALANALPGQRLGVIDFDTHHDVRAGWEGNSGLWARQIQELPGNPVRGENIVQIGIHGFAYSQYYYEQVKAMGLAVYKPADVRRLGMEAVMEAALRRAADGTQAIYVSVDIDVMDAPYAPGTNEAPHGGLQPWQVIEGVVMAGQHPLVRALDVMEISPPLDINNLTCSLGVEILMQFLGALALRKGRG